MVVVVNGTSASIDAPAAGAVLAIGASINPSSRNIDWSGLSERTEWTDPPKFDSKSPKRLISLRRNAPKCDYTVVFQVGFGKFSVSKSSNCSDVVIEMPSTMCSAIFAR